MKKLSLTLAALFCAGSLCAAPTEPVTIGSITYDTACEVAGTPLKLNGAGLRKIVFFKVYAGGLYVSAPTTDAAKVFTDEKARRVRLGLLRDVDGADFVEALEEGLNANLTPEKKAAIEKEVATLKTVMQTIGDWRLGELSDQEKIDSLRLGDVLEIEEGNSSNFLLALQDTTLGELSERSDMLTLSEIIGEDELQKNKLLKHLGNSTIQTLSDDVNAVSLETIFGEEYFSYAATADYEAARGAGKPVESDKLLDPERVQTVYKTAAGTQVVTGTFLITEQGGWKLLEGVTANIYRWQRPVDAVKEYRIVNYETGTLDPLPDGADVVTEGGKDYYVTGGERYEIVKTDPYADYVEIGGERIDLELTVVAYLYSDTQAAVPADVTVAYDGEADAYYVTESAETLRRYYDPTALSPEGIAPEVYGEDDVTVSFFTQEGAPVTRFVAGAWMLIVGEDGAKGATSVTGISDALEDIPEQVSNLTLQEMYCNGLLTDDPSLDISRLNYTLDGKLYTDLDQFNIRQFTEFVEYLLGQVPTEP